MKHDIDIFYPPTHPRDHRWDRDQNAEILNIVFSGGTFGNFLKFFIDKFSTRSPEIKGHPFTASGISHRTDGIEFSGLFQKYHESFINDNEGKLNLPVCIILPSTKKHYLYLKKAKWFRAGNDKISPDALWKKAVGEMPELIIDHAKEIIKLYDIKDTAHFTWIPKFIVRDWYKLEFLQDLEVTYNHQWFDTFKHHKFFEKQKVFHLDLETFFNWESFVRNITRLDQMFGLELDFDRNKEMKALFSKGLELDSIRKECNLAEAIIDRGEENLFRDLDVSTEGFIYAEMEKANDFIQMPLTNRFFRDTEELRQFVEHYPSHYKAMNPNMSKFNGIANPYYLKKDK